MPLNNRFETLRFGRLDEECHFANKNIPDTTPRWSVSLFEQEYTKYHHVSLSIEQNAVKMIMSNDRPLIMLSFR